jgi:hypothetical protein
MLTGNEGEFMFQNFLRSNSYVWKLSRLDISNDVLISKVADKSPQIIENVLREKQWDLLDLADQSQLFLLDRFYKVDFLREVNIKGKAYKVAIDVTVKSMDEVYRKARIAQNKPRFREIGVDVYLFVLLTDKFEQLDVESSFEVSTLLYEAVERAVNSRKFVTTFMY